MLNKTVFIFSLAFSSVLASTCFADSALDRSLRSNADVPGLVKEGEQLFQQICASCHAKDLSGASGFNLKDGEWVHGGSPSDILNSIKTGFSNAGMPAFVSVFSESQLQNIVSYILSKREGFDGLEYRLYQMDDESDTEIVASKLIKSGALQKNLADFEIPEIADYALVFEGDFYTSKTENTKIWIEWGKIYGIHFEIDGEPIAPLGDPWSPLWLLKRGKQQLKITYFSATSRPEKGNPNMMAVNDSNTVKLFGISTRAKKIMDGKNIEVKAKGRPLVQRKKIYDLPAYSISVGYPQNINYAFNSKTCSVVALWQGDLLNVGPNVEGRGRDGSLPLGEWLFKSPDSLVHTSDKETSGKKGSNDCRYLGYSLSNNNPIFRYEQGGERYSISADVASKNTIHFNYSGPANSTLDILVPQVDGMYWESGTGVIKESTLSIMSDKNGKFTITAHIK